MQPVKPRARVSFSARCYMFVAGQIFDGKFKQDCAGQCCERLVLHWLEQAALDTFKFNADRMVVAIRPPEVHGLPRMPGAMLTTYKLPQPSLATDKEMSRHLQTAQRLKVRVCVPVQLIAE